MTPAIKCLADCMQSGHNVVLFTISDTLFSKLIRFFTKSSVSHCAFYVGSHWVSDSTIQYGVSVRTDASFYKVQKPVRAFKVFDPRAAVANYIHDKYHDKGYGCFDVIWLFLTNVFKRVTRFKNPIQDGYVCSEYVARYLDNACHSSLYSSSNPPTPEDLLKWCVKNLEEIKIGNDI